MDEKTEINGFFKNSIIHLALIIWSIGAVFPVLFLGYSSLKTNGEIIVNRLAFPKTFYLGNYNFSEIGFTFGKYFRNSISITIITLVLLVIFSYIAAYAIAKIPFMGKNIVIILLVSLIGVPMHALIIPIYYYISDMGLLNRYLGVILPYLAQFAPLQILILQSFFRKFPDEVIEAARVDGCNNINAFIRIVFPMSLGAISTVIIISFINIWNEFLLVFILLKDKESRTLTLGLREFVGQYSTNWGGTFAVMFIMIMPTLIIYLIFHRNIIKGIGDGSIKG
jgi:raffinose/stachyose/melibiose transport system permease protein